MSASGVATLIACYSANTFATLNPADKGASITLSNGNLTASNLTSAWNSVRTTISKSSGKWYWETKVTVVTTSPQLGLADGSASMATFLSNTTKTVSLQSASTEAVSGAGLTQDWGSPSFTWVANDVVMHGLDMDNGRYYAGANGTWYNSAVPASGTGFIAHGMSGAWFPAVSLFNATLIANFGASAFAFSVPSGFNSGVFQ